MRALVGVLGREQPVRPVRQEVRHQRLVGQQGRAASSVEELIAPGRKILQTVRPCTGCSTSATRARKPGESAPSMRITGNGIVHTSPSVSTRPNTRSRSVGSRRGRACPGGLRSDGVPHDIIHRRAVAPHAPRRVPGDRLDPLHDPAGRIRRRPVVALSDDRRHVAGDDERVRGARGGREAAARAEAAGDRGAARRVEPQDLQHLQAAGDARHRFRERHGPALGHDEDAQPQPRRRNYAIVTNELLRLDFLGGGHRRSVGPAVNAPCIGSHSM